MSRVSSATLHANRARRKIEIVVNDDDFIGRDAIGFHEIGNRTARKIHIALGLCKDDRFAIERTRLHFGNERAALVLPIVRAPFACQHIDRIETGIVARVSVVFARISQANDKIHR